MIARNGKHGHVWMTFIYIVSAISQTPVINKQHTDIFKEKCSSIVNIKIFVSGNVSGPTDVPSLASSGRFY